MGDVLGELITAGAPAAVEGGQMVAASALLAEALWHAEALEPGLLDLPLADATALVVRRQPVKVPAALLHLPCAARGRAV